MCIRDSFDFEAMSRILAKSSRRDNLSETRRNRVTNRLATLRSQRFFPMSEADVAEAAEETYAFDFDSCVDALAAYRQRLPGLIELARACLLYTSRCV